MAIAYLLEKPFSFQVLPRVFQNHRLVPLSSTSSSFPKKSPHYLLCPSYLSCLSPRSGGPCHKLSINQSIPLLSSSSFISLLAEAYYPCITGPQYPLTSFCILSALLVISLCSLENNRFHQQLSLSIVSMSRGDMQQGCSCFLHFPLIYLFV